MKHEPSGSLRVFGSGSFHVWLFLFPNACKDEMPMLHDYRPKDATEKTGCVQSAGLLS